MKKYIYLLFNRKVYTRYIRLHRKQRDRLQRVLQANKELNKWHDIPISWQAGSLCDLLKIKNNEAARSFLSLLTIARSIAEINELAKKLPL